MFLGIEIGGTKLQLGVGRGDGELAELLRFDIQPAHGAAGIREQIAEGVTQLRRRFELHRVGFGFGGPIDRDRGVITTSHQISGWTDFPMRDWCRDKLELECILGNDCDCATLAEASFGAGRGFRRVFYVTVGTGVGGGFVVDGINDGTYRPAIAEIGHLRPGVACDSPEQTVESIASGWGLAAWTRDQLQTPQSKDELALLEICDHQLEELTGKQIGELAAAGNAVARAAVERGVQTLGWATAQVATLIAPDVIVIGGGVSLLGDALFYEPLRRYFDQYVFPPLRGKTQILPPQLGEEVVVHGALAICNTG